MTQKTPMIAVRYLKKALNKNQSVIDTSINDSKKFLKPILLGLFILWTADFFIKIALDKHLSLDGVNYFYHILQHEGFANIAWSRRYTEYLTEWPLVWSWQVNGVSCF